MEFRIADTFIASLARLTGGEQKAVKTTAFDLQLNPSSPGLRFHRLDRPRDPKFWSVRVNDDIRLIVHRTPTSLWLCYLGHHDPATQRLSQRLEGGGGQADLPAAHAPGLELHRRNPQPRAAPREQSEVCLLPRQEG